VYHSREIVLELDDHLLANQRLEKRKENLLKEEAL
jgi:hypothetical protein